MIAVRTLTSHFESFLFGFTLPFQSFGLIVRRPKLLAWSIIPILITVFFYVYLIAYVQSGAAQILSNALASHGINPEGWFAHLVIFLIKILAFIISIITFSFVSSAVACPFNDFLAEASEGYTSPPLARIPSQGWLQKGRLIALDLFKTGIATALNLIALLVSWIPLINILALIATFLIISFQFLSYPQTRRGQGVREGALFIVRNFFACVGFGASVSLLFAIPILSSLSLPLAVVGGTLLFAKSSR